MDINWYPGHMAKAKRLLGGSAQPRGCGGGAVRRAPALLQPQSRFGQAAGGQKARAAAQQGGFG